MLKHKILIADDEELARNRLKRLLVPFELFEIIGEAANGLEALELSKALKPDFVFLDIEMPGLSGLEVANRLGFNGPKIVFVTGYDEYALKAFESNSIDYLVKPIKKERLKDTVLKLKSHTSKLEEKSSTFSFKIGDKIHIVKEDRIKYIQSDGGYAKVVTMEGEFLANDTLDSLESFLNSNTFFRAHRSSIVNLNQIDFLKRIGDRNFQIYLKSGEVLKVSRGKHKALTDKLSS